MPQLSASILSSLSTAEKPRVATRKKPQSELSSRVAKHPRSGELHRDEPARVFQHESKSCRNNKEHVLSKRSSPVENREWHFESTGTDTDNKDSEDGDDSSEELLRALNASAARRRERHKHSSSCFESRPLHFRSSAPSSVQIPAEESHSVWNRENLTDDHRTLLYLISKYTFRSGRCLEDEDAEQYRWIRHVPLMVLIFEGITSDIFNYDYAPAAILVGTRRTYCNISQEGKDDIDDLREAGFIYSLKLMSTQQRALTAYQLSDDGVQLLSERLPLQIKETVDKFLDGPGGLWNVFWNGEAFVLESGGIMKTSAVTDCEDVSYATSPYIPRCLRCGGRPTSDNFQKAAQQLSSHDNIKDDLSEVIHLDNVRVLVVEWIPFGVNQTVAMNERVGSSERIQGGFFTAAKDVDPEETYFEFKDNSEDLTVVTPLDSASTRYLNFEAEIRYPEDEGIVQLEHFGVHVHTSGSIIYGLQVESILNRLKNGMSLDHLARLLVDVHSDSSKLMKGLMSTYQKSLMDIVFYGDAQNRDKLNCIIAEKVSPELSASAFLDKEEKENELKQILGETKYSTDLDNGAILVVGSQGLLFVSSNPHEAEATLISYMTLAGIDLFVRDFFIRTFVLDEQLKEIRGLINTYNEDPTRIPLIRKLLGETSHHIAVLEEILQFLMEALSSFASNKDLGDATYQNELERALDLDHQYAYVLERIHDLKKTLVGAKTKQENLRDMMDVVTENEQFRIQENLQANTKSLEDVFRANERASSSLEMMQIILSGSLAFDILDRLTGEWSVAETWWASKYIVEPLIHTPGVWFALNLFLWFLLGYGLYLLSCYLSDKAQGVLMVRLKPNWKISLKRLKGFLKKKDIKEEEVSADGSNRIYKTTWEEEASPTNGPWGTLAPRVELVYDPVHEFILKAVISVQTNGHPTTEEDIVKRLEKDLRQEQVLATEGETAEVTSTGIKTFT
mmetsp:Transcript_26750/g.68774  ORF Transcript_26750/g.68774 Transcript_26750/m.68774 type:complete len:962 (+) Transcript_26750:123-3008(+)